MGGDHDEKRPGIALLLGVAIAGVIFWVTAAAVEPLAVTQPLMNLEQPLISATEARRLSDRQQLNRYFLQNWRDRPTRPNFN
jgi:hypothetical protein